MLIILILLQLLFFFEQVVSQQASCISINHLEVQPFNLYTYNKKDSVLSVAAQINGGYGWTSIMGKGGITGTTKNTTFSSLSQKELYFESLQCQESLELIFTLWSADYPTSQGPFHLYFNCMEIAQHFQESFVSNAQELNFTLAGGKYTSYFKYSGGTIGVSSPNIAYGSIPSTFTAWKVTWTISATCPYIIQCPNSDCLFQGCTLANDCELGTPLNLLAKPSKVMTPFKSSLSFEMGLLIVVFCSFLVLLFIWLKQRRNQFKIPLKGKLIDDNTQREEKRSMSSESSETGYKRIDC